MQDALFISNLHLQSNIRGNVSVLEYRCERSLILYLRVSWPNPQMFCLQAKSELVNRTRELVQVLDRAVSAARDRHPITYSQPPSASCPSVDRQPSPLYFIDTDPHPSAEGPSNADRSLSNSPIRLAQPIEYDRKFTPLTFVDEIEEEFNQYDYPELHNDSPPE
jgi:hypothetical protein